MALSGQRLASARAGLDDRPFRVKSNSERQSRDKYDKDDAYHFDDESIDDEYELSPQWLLCALDQVNYTSLVKVETLGKDLHQVFRKMGMTSGIIPELNVSSDLAEARRVYSDLRVRQRAGRLFRKDVSTFGYTLKDLAR